MKLFRGILLAGFLASASSIAHAATAAGTIGLSLGSAYTDPTTQESNIAWVHVSDYRWSDGGGFVYSACGYLSQAAANAGATPVYCTQLSISQPSTNPRAAAYTDLISKLSANTPTQVGTP